MFIQAVFLILVFLLGSVPTGAWICAHFSEGRAGASRANLEADEVAVRDGWRLGLVVMALDIAKGFLPILLARSLGETPGFLQAVAVAVFTAHLIGVYSEFRGGKGIGTGLGVLLALAPIATLAAMAVGIGIWFLRRSLVASVLATLVAVPLATLVFDSEDMIVAILVSGCVIFRYREDARMILRSLRG